ncbi:hypothetical protein EVAR_59053_1 [Eumeta japonica]|uniref:Uncharacterized protein n=1 Tax=Eumeta variegata TaxID=151549 RepID=A0A4C1YDV3_EUMVA|nr:hypothetical protein EVAR_59053_1 [Eumeta japonica]
MIPLNTKCLEAQSFISDIPTPMPCTICSAVVVALMQCRSTDLNCSFTVGPVRVGTANDNRHLYAENFEINNMFAGHLTDPVSVSLSIFADPDVVLGSTLGVDVGDKINVARQLRHIVGVYSSRTIF